MNNETKELSDRIKELGDKPSQVLTFLSFALVVVVLLETSQDHVFTPHQKCLATIAMRWWAGAIFPILLGVLPWKEFCIFFGCNEPSWYRKIRVLKFVLLWIAVPMIIVGAFELCRAIWRVW
jgi:hypothetical protein